MVAAEPGDSTRIAADQGNAAGNVELEPGNAPLPQVPRFELSFPGREFTVVEPKPLDTATLHLDTPAYGTSTDPALESQRDKARRRPLFEWEPSTQSPRGPLWPMGSDEPTTASMPRVRPSITQDQRSAWARWNSSLWGASATVGTAMVTTVVVLSFFPKDFTGWNRPNFDGLKKNFTEGPSFDFDNFFFNYIAHPIDGSEFYLVARNRGLTWWQSFAYAAAVSTVFEFLIESAYERASWQDLWITPVSGTVIGELRWQAKKALENPHTGKPSGTANKILYVVIDPVDAIFNL